MEKSAYRVSHFFVFMGKRLLRLQPPMMISACIVALTSWTMLNTDTYNGWQLLAASVTLTAPFFDLPWVNGIYWTLFVEMQYYIYIALAYPLLTSSRILYRSLIVIALLALSFASLSMEGHSAKSNLPFHLPVFLMGYYLFMQYKNRISKTEFYAGIMVCFCVCLYLTAVLHGLGYRICITAGLTTIIIATIRHGIAFISRIGEWSYSLYLLHWPVISALCFVLGGMLKTASGNAIVFCAIQIVSIAVAWLFYRIVEKPSMRLAKTLLRYR